MFFNYKLYARKTAISYIAVLITIAIQLIFSLITSLVDMFSNQTSFQFNEVSGGIFILMISAIVALTLSQAILLITTIFDLNKLFGLDNKKSIKGIITFTLMNSFVIAIAFILFNLITSSFNNSPQLTFGMDWSNFSNLFIKFSFILFAVTTIYALGMWMLIGSTKYGALIGLSRIALVASYCILHGKYLNSFAQWGINGPLNIIVFAIVSITLYTFIYFEMLTYERK